MGAVSGLTGKVMVASATVLNVSDWSLDLKNNIQDKSSFADTWETKLSGLRGATGTIKGQTNTADTTGQVALTTAFLNGTAVALKLYDDTATYWNIASAFISDLKSGDSVNGIATTEFTFVADGAVTKV
jgi:hypothetical protein